jgi:hypothetical protein
VRAGQKPLHRAFKLLQKQEARTSTSTDFRTGIGSQHNIPEECRLRPRSSSGMKKKTTRDHAMILSIPSCTATVFIFIGTTLLSGCGESEGTPEGNGSSGGQDTGSSSGGRDTTNAGGADGDSLGSGGQDVVEGSGGFAPGGGGPQASGGTDSSSGGQATGGVSAGGSNSTGGAVGGDSTGGGGAALPEVTWPLINGVQWADVAGDPIQAHGGGMIKVGAVYYWLGENRNSDGTFYAVTAYRSQDLRRWERAGDLLTMNSDPDLNPANVERPKVVYNESTGKYVMWMHWENGEHYGEARAAVASSDTIDGEYTYHGSFRPYQDSGVIDHDRPGYMSRDCTLFVDDDGKAYFLSASNENVDLNLYVLSDDYLSIESLVTVLFAGGRREAPAIFKRNDTYFLVTSGLSGWDPNQGQYATSASLTSGWSGLKNVGNGNTFYSQSTYVQAIEGAGSTEYLYLGDRWAGAWGGPVNDSSYLWQPISFPNDTTMEMSWFDTLDLDTTVGAVSGSMASFLLVNKGSELRLSVEGDATQNGADLIQAPDSDTAQVWRLDYNGAGFFRLKNDSSDKVVDIPDESTASGVLLHLWDDNGGDHQAWKVIDLGQGEYRVQNKKSGLYLSVTGASPDANARIEQQSDSGGDEQIWRIAVAP